MDDKKSREFWRISDAGECPSRQVYAKRFDADRLHGDSEREMIAIKTKSPSPLVMVIANDAYIGHIVDPHS